MKAYLNLILIEVTSTKERESSHKYIQAFLLYFLILYFCFIFIRPGLTKWIKTRPNEINIVAAELLTALIIVSTNCR